MILLMIIFLTMWYYLHIYSQASNKEYNYGNEDFVISSAAVVEQLWSLADKIVDGVHNNNTPIVLEVLLFL